MNSVENFDKMAKAIEYPERPSKPSIGHNPTAKEARDYALAIEEYEEKMEVFNRERLEYNVKTREVFDKFEDWAIEECGLKELVNRHGVYNYAWQENHANGMSEVFNCLSEISELFEVHIEIAKRMGKMEALAIRTAVEGLSEVQVMAEIKKLDI